MKRPLILALCLSQSLSLQAWADSSEQIVLLQSPEVSRESFLANTQAHAMIPYAEWAARDFAPTSQQKATLRSALRRGQELWVDGSLSEAQAQFQIIAGLALSADWSTAERETIQYAMLRLAQQSNSTTERDRWLNLAVSFAADLNPDPSLFPPPMITAYSNTRSHALASAEALQLREKFAGYRILKINGRAFDLGRDGTPISVQLPKGRYRLTALSDSLLPFNATLDSSDIVGMSPPTNDLAKGSCENPALATPSTRQIAVLYANDCLRIHRDGQWVKKLNSSDLVRVESKLGANPNPAITWPSVPEQNTSVSKKTWIWIAVAAVAAGAAYAIHNEQSRETKTVVRPVTGEGG